MTTHVAASSVAAGIAFAIITSATATSTIAVTIVVATIDLSVSLWADCLLHVITTLKPYGCNYCVASGPVVGALAASVTLPVIRSYAMMVGMASGQLVELWSGKVRSYQGQVTRRAPTHKKKGYSSNARICYLWKGHSAAKK